MPNREGPGNSVYTCFACFPLVGLCCRLPDQMGRPLNNGRRIMTWIVPRFKERRGPLFNAQLKPGPGEFSRLHKGNALWADMKGLPSWGSKPN